MHNSSTSPRRVTAYTDGAFFTDSLLLLPQRFIYVIISDIKLSHNNRRLAFPQNHDSNGRGVLKLDKNFGILPGGDHI